MVAVRRGCSHRHAICAISYPNVYTIAYQIRKQTQSTKIAHTSLSGLGLLLSTNDRDEGNVDQGKVFVTDSELELSHSLNEGCRLDVSHRSTELSISNAEWRVRCSAYLDDANIRLLSRLVDRDLGDPLNPILNGVGQVRNDLDGFTKVIAFSLRCQCGPLVSSPAHLAVDDMLVNLSGRHVVVLSKRDV